MSQLFERLQAVHDRASFLLFVRALEADRWDEVETGVRAVPLGGEPVRVKPAGKVSW
jgi:hypothetical protein